jgi:hypothetical protein
LPALRQAVQKCRGCDLYKNATQAVFGEIITPSARNGSKASIMMIGEQPGDREDVEGFLGLDVSPAQILGFCKWALEAIIMAPIRRG